uniref:TnrB n=1 Tax=Mycobacterium leprae TaxID=1769 RepID=Q49967_MYCLR|nr:tnrB [Mycobacterium leprae]
MHTGQMHGFLGPNSTEKCTTIHILLVLANTDSENTTTTTRRRHLDRPRRISPEDRLCARNCHAVVFANRNRNYRFAGPHAWRHRRELARRATKALRP